MTILPSFSWTITNTTYGRQLRIVPKFSDNRSGQTVQTRIRLVLAEQSDPG